MSNTTFKRIVCLANSRKLSGRCVAGKEILGDGVSGGWIRPVSNRPEKEVSWKERRYKDGGDPSVLDVIKIPLRSAEPRSYQQENWLLDPGYYWEKVNRIGSDDLQRLADSPTSLWIDGHCSANGRNDRVPQSLVNGIVGSLLLIRVRNLDLEVFPPGLSFGNPKRRVQGRFQHKGTDYWLWVTDPSYEQEYLSKPNGRYPVGECFLTVSLGDLHDGYAYKLIAAIFRPE